MNKTIFVVLLFGIAMLTTPPVKALPPPCTTAPCTVADGGAGTTIAGYALAADSSNIAVAANDFIDMSPCIGSGYNASWTGLFTAANPAGPWSGGCQAPSGTDQDPNWEPVAVYDNNGNLLSGQLGATATTDGVFLKEGTGGSYFPTLIFTDPGIAQFYNFDFPGIAIDAKNCVYIAAWEFGTQLSNNKPASAIAVGHACNPTNADWSTISWTTVRVNPTLIVGKQVVSYPRVSAQGNGNVLVTWVQNNGGKTPQVFSSFSSDGGNTWSAPTNVFSISQTAAAVCPDNDPHVDRALPHTCVRMFYYPELAVTNSVATGRVFHAVYPNHAASGKISINYRLGTLDGSTFTGPTVLSTVAGDTGATGDQFEPCIAASGQKIGIAWLDTRNSPTGQPDSVYDAFAMTATVSEGGGGPQIAYGTVHQLSTENNGTMVETKANSEYLGDWTGCGWQSGTFYYVFPSTTSGHQVAMIAGL